MPKVTWLRSGRVRDGAHITSPSAQYSFWFVIPASLNPSLCCYWILKLFFIWHECVCGATSNTQQEYLLGWSNCCNKQPPRSQQLAARVVGRVKTASCSHWGIQAPPIFFLLLSLVHGLQGHCKGEWRSIWRRLVLAMPGRGTHPFHTFL